MIGALIACAFLLGMVIGWAALPVICLLALVLLVAEQFTWPVLLLTILAACAGVLRASDGTATLNPAIPAMTNLEVTVVGSVVDDGRRQVLTIEPVSGGKLCVDTFARTDLGRGDHLEVDFEPESAALIKDGHESRYTSQGCVWGGTISNITVQKSGDGFLRQIDEIRQRITRQFVEWIPGDRGALLAGLVIGDDSLLSWDAETSFRETGTLHVVAISGSNLTLLAGLLLPLFAWLPRRWMNEVVALAIVWAYVLIGGARPPTVRAGALATAGAIGRFVGRPVDLLTLSLQVAAIQVAVFPDHIHGLSYQMTTIAILVVVLTIAGRPVDSIWRTLLVAVITTAAVQTALFPLLPPGARPNIVIAVLANILIAPFIAVAFVLGILATLTAPFVPVVGEAIAQVAAMFSGIVLDIVQSLATVDAPLVSGDKLNLPEWLVVAIALASVASVSKEFHRFLGDTRAAMVTNRSYMAPMVAGLGVGALLGTVVLLLLSP